MGQSSPHIAKYSVIGTVTHRSNTVCSTPELIEKELEHLWGALKQCKYPRWALNKIQNRTQQKQTTLPPPTTKDQQTNTKDTI